MSLALLVVGCDPSLQRAEPLGASELSTIERQHPTLFATSSELPARPVRAMGALSTLTVSTFYMIAQMVGAGALVSLLLHDTGIGYQTAVIGIGVLMIVYVVFGGMLATTWVQIVKAILLMAGTVLLSVLVLQHFDFTFGAFFDAKIMKPCTNEDLVERLSSLAARQPARGEVLHGHAHDERAVLLRRKR